MLRLLALVLLAANLLFFGWSMGWLDAVVGVRAQGDREPERLARQVRPELMTLAQAPQAPQAAASASESAVLSAASSPAAEQAAAGAAGAFPPASGPASAVAANAEPVNTTCIEAGPFGASELAAAEGAIRAIWPEASWTQRRIAGSGEWMIYMGPYSDDAWIARKKAELSRIRGGMPNELVSSPPELARGLSLGRFPSEAEAEKRLDQYRLRGIRTARIVKSGDGPARTYLRVAAADTAMVARLATVKWPAGQAGFSACSKDS